MHNARFWRQILTQLRREKLLLASYSEALNRHREVLVKYQEAPFLKNQKKLENLQAELVDVKDQLISIMSSEPQAEGKKISELAQEHAPANEQAQILLLVEEIRSLVEKVKKETTEFRVVTQFGLQVVHGSLSLLWQGTQNVARNYTPHGEIKESLTPSRSRKEITLREA
jgi:hypothetical protein